jgi:hypothetical protein
MEVIREHVIELFERIDTDTLMAGPNAWTIDGQPLTADQRELLLSTTLAELEAIGSRCQ